MTQVRWFSFEWFKHEALQGFDYVWRMDADLWVKFPVGDGGWCGGGGDDDDDVGNDNNDDDDHDDDVNAHFVALSLTACACCRYRATSSL